LRLAGPFRRPVSASSLFATIPSSSTSNPFVFNSFDSNPFVSNPFGSGTPCSTFSYRNFSSKSLSLRELPSPCCALFTAIPSVQESRVVIPTSVFFIEIPLAQEAPPTSPCCVLFTAIPSAQESRARPSLIGTFHRNPFRSGNARQRLLVALFSLPSLQLRKSALDLLSSELFIEIPFAQGAPANASLLRSFYRHPFGPGIPRSTFSYQYFSSKSLSLRKRRQPLLVAFFSPQSLRLRNPALDFLLSVLFIEIPLAQGTPVNVSLLRSFYRNSFGLGGWLIATSVRAKGDPIR